MRLLLLLGCAEPPAADPASPTAWAPSFPTEDPVPLTASELEEGLAAAIAYLHRLDPLAMHEAWTEVFWSNADEGCPTMDVHNGQDHWEETCTSSTGAEFNGWTLNFRDGNFPADGVWVWQYAWLSGAATIAMADGTTLESYGDNELLVATEPDGTNTWDGFVWGDFHWDDPAVAGTWLAEDESGETYFHYEDHDTWRLAELDAALTFLDGPVLAARFEGVAVDDIDGACTATGRVRLRDLAGSWYSLGASCGCTASTVGEVCADWTPLVDWDAWPWEV